MDYEAFYREQVDAAAKREAELNAEMKANGDRLESIQRKDSLTEREITEFEECARKQLSMSREMNTQVEKREFYTHKLRGISEVRLFGREIERLW